MRNFEKFDPRGPFNRKVREENDPDAADVLMFIGRFSTNSRGSAYRREVIECFTQGCCFWFAHILKARFGEDAEIMADYVVGHFGTRIRGRVYDITGDVTDGYNGVPYRWEPWEDLKDDELKSRIFRDCIMF